MNRTHPARTLALLAAGLLAAQLAGCRNYDRLVDLDTTADQRWADVEANLQRRADLVPNLVATVKGSAAHEEKTLKEVMEARAKATSMHLSTEDLQDPAKVQQFSQAQDQLRGALSRLLVVQEAYPQLQANQQFHALMVELEGTENRILRAREQYNAAAREYNAELNKVHGQVVRRATGSTFRPRAYITASESARQVPQVNF